MTGPQPSEGIPHPRRSWLRRRWKLVAVMLIALAVTVVCVVPWPGPTLPDPSDIATMKATLEVKLTGDGPPDPAKLAPGRVSFTVPAEHIPRIIAALQPATRDRWLVPKWVHFGDLDITLKNGETVQVDLYYTFQERGAFSVQPDYPRTPRNSGLVSSYFRGGTDEGLTKALAEAYHASQKQ